MPLYYFDIHNDVFTKDYEGAELPDLEAARRHAVDGVRSLAADTVRHGHLDPAHHIEILDADRRPLAKVTFGEAVEIR